MPQFFGKLGRDSKLHTSDGKPLSGGGDLVVALEQETTGYVFVDASGDRVQVDLARIGAAVDQLIGKPVWIEGLETVKHYPKSGQVRVIVARRIIGDESAD